jgi:hypothetical protein
MSGEQNPNEESKAEELNKKNRLLLIGGIVLLILPLLIILLSKLSALHEPQPSQMNGSIFYARTMKVGQKLTPAETPAPPGAAPTLTPPVSNQSSLNLVVGDKTPQTPPPPKPKKKTKKIIKKSFKPKSLAQIRPRKLAKTIQPASIPQLRPSPFGNPASQGGSPIPSPGSGQQAPNTGDIIKNIKNLPQEQGIPPNVQQTIQQSAQQAGGAPAVPSPTGQQ